MPVNLEVYYQDGSSTLEQVWVEKEDHQFRIPNPNSKVVSFSIV